MCVCVFACNNSLFENTFNFLITIILPLSSREVAHAWLDEPMMKIHFARENKRKLIK